MTNLKNESRFYKKELRLTLKINHRILCGLIKALDLKNDLIYEDKIKIERFYKTEIKGKFATVNDFAKLTGASIDYIFELINKGLIKNLWTLPNGVYLIDLKNKDFVFQNSNRKKIGVLRTQVFKDHKQEVKDIANILINQHTDFKNLGNRLLKSIENLESVGG